MSADGLASYRLVIEIYGKDLPAKVVPAAERGLLLHLDKLEQEGRVISTKRDGEAQWELKR